MSRLVSGKQFLQRDHLKNQSILCQMQEDQVQSIIMNCPGESGITGVNQRGFDPIRCNLSPVLEFLTTILHQGLEYNKICGYSSAISAYHDSTGPFSLGKHPRISNLITGIFDNRMLQRRHCFMWDVDKVIVFLNSLNSDRIELKILT